MIANLQYLRYVVRHKWYVLVAGLKLGVPLWRLLIHDFSKFSRSEWKPYVNNFYAYHNGGRPQWVRDAFDVAWLHHQHRNRHHWQHWILKEDSGTLKILEMPYDLAKEMVADWAGAGRVITGKWEIKEWYEKNKEKIQLHPETRDVVEILLYAYYGHNND